MSRGSGLCGGLCFFLVLIAQGARTASANLMPVQAYPFPNQVLYTPPGVAATVPIVAHMQAAGLAEGTTVDWVVTPMLSRGQDSIELPSESLSSARHFQYFKPQAFSLGELGSGDYHLRWRVVAGGKEIENDLATEFKVRPQPDHAKPPQGLKFRAHLGSFLNAHGLTGKGVEVGVKMGEFSEQILSEWRGELLYLVDPWAHQGDEYRDMANVQQQEQDHFMAIANQRVSRFGDRAELIRDFSLNAAREFFDNATMDFVYLDAMHEYEFVLEDLRAWWPKVKPGGLFCGHDYKDGIMPHAYFGVMAAVDEFAASLGLEAMWTMGAQYNWSPIPAPDASSSWYFFKPLDYQD